MKMLGITSLCCDIIFLSDIRLGEIEGQNGDFKVRQWLSINKYRSYVLHCNSTRNKRGVGILIGSNVEYKLIDEYKDQTENILAQHCKIKNRELILCSIYGPNSTDREFYRNLNVFLNAKRGIEIILGGDWNTTWDNGPADDNIDVFNMMRTPNQTNGNLLHDLCNNFSLTEPYRLLHPEKKTFTYAPFGSTRKNKSRLDFFIVSSSLVKYMSSVDSAQYKLNKLFDHSPVSMVIGKNKPPPEPPKLNNTFLKDKLLKWSVFLSALQVYSRALDAGAVPEVVALLTEVCNSMTNLVIECVRIRKAMTQTDPDYEAKNLILVRNYNELERIYNRVPEFKSLSDMRKNVDEKTFFTALTDRISEKAATMQQKLGKIKNIRKRSLIKELDRLSLDPDSNIDTISVLERDLNLILDAEFRSFVLDNKTFNVVNNEKPTEHFMNLARTKKAEASINSVVNEDGGNFEDELSRNEYIRNFYSNLYRKDELPERTIEDFLGPAAEHPVVTNSKLSAQEKAELDTPYSINELDKSLEAANFKSAPGIDSYSNRFINEFWIIFREPLFKCFAQCLDEACLTENFATAQIRLIPKKGDVTKLKNWRPISLLSNFYKILSRAINSRLKKIVNRVLSRAQKGFNKSRQIQEVIINTAENIEFCKKMVLREQ
jgi:exonuclease III